jgi:hypothetical protein
MPAVASAQASERTTERARNTTGLRPFRPGQSGNPGGRPSNGKRYQELFAAIASEFGELTALEHEYIARAAEQLRRAERSKDNNDHVRLTRCAAQLVDRVRQNRRERQEAEPVPSLAELGL